MSNVESSSSKANDYFTRLEVDGEEGGEFIDHWDTGELLFLASSVQRSDRNWVSVARGLKLYGEQTRPADFYTPKNCALQYTKLLSEVDEDSKKKTLPRTERETSEAMLVKNLTDKRLTELAWLNQQTKSAANMLKNYVEMVESGEFDDQLDDLLKNIEEKEKREEEKYVEYISRRESLNATKKLNKSRLAKGKAAKVIDSKKKSSPFSDMSEDSPSKVAEVVKSIKKEIEEEEMVAASVKQIKIKSELDANISLNALLDTKVTMPSSVSPTSPLLTSLLRTITSTSSVSPALPPLSNSPLKENIKAEASSCSIGQSSIRETSKKIDVFLSPTTIPSSISPLLTSLLKSATPLPPLSTSMASLPKESDHNEGDHTKSGIDIGGYSKSKETSPRGSIPQSPRPTPSSSPLLNSLLKNSPSSSTMASRDVSPKAVSSPQPFFNPSSVLASAAAQQLAVATSTQSLSHQFFPQEASDSRKASFQSSPITSACLAAPTLSKLLEMPPSAPGRLPPLPVLDPPIISTYTTPVKTISNQLQNEIKPIVPEFSLTKKSINKGSTSLQPVVESTVSETSSTNASLKISIGSNAETKKVEPIDSKPIIVVKNDTVSNKALPEETSENIKVEATNEELMETSLDKIHEETSEFFPIDDKQDVNIKKDNLFGTDTIITEILETGILDDLQEIIKSDLNLCKMEPETESPVDITLVKTSEEFVDKELSKKPSITGDASKTEDVASPVLLTQIQIKKEPESPPKKLIPITETESPSKNTPSHKSDERISDTLLDIKIEEDSDVKSPVSKKPRLYESVCIEKQPVSEDEMPAAIRRSGRKPKKNRGRASKPPPSEPSEPKDHYEFTESADESSAGFPTSNMLRYGSRIKEVSRTEEKTKVINQDPEETLNSSSADSPTVEKKLSPLKTKPGGLQSYSRGKSPFATDEDVISDSIASDDASSSMLTEDKLKKWEESTEKHSEVAKSSGGIKTLQKTAKTSGESSKKKQSNKRHLSSSSNTPSKKERKLTGSDFDELSACSRDSEDVPNSWKQDKESADKKNQKNINPLESKIETADSHMSSSVTAESEPMDDIESLQGSITAEFSPLPVSEIKDEKDTSQFGKQDWFQGISPKSSEHVSQSSEESEYESDNWDSHSVSTNKSASHSSDPQPRTKRKERESAQHKAWKKAIHIVLREASCHKYANVFLQKVTNDVAPGYSSIVYRPMDLSLIKKNIDNGVIKTTEEFYRDMLLMFQNAIMYNSSDHDVYKMAVGMQHDVMLQIMAFLATQYNDKDEHREPTSSLRGARATKSQKGGGKQSATTSSSSKVKEEVERD